MRVFTAAEVGKELCLSSRTVCRRCVAGEFSGAYREGVRWRIPEEAIKSYLAMKQKETKDIGCKEE